MCDAEERLAELANHGKADKSNQESESIEDQIVETQHQITINGELISYTATCGTLVLRDEKEQARASIFFVAYTRNGVENLNRRSLTFSFNGGPGSSSVWMHLGTLGPRRVEMDEAGVGMAPAPPYTMIDNEYSILDMTDLVFIDPVATGYSRAAPGEDVKQFHGWERDVESVAEFIRLYCTRYRRWTSPKYIIGESYGTTRAAGLAEHLQDLHGMYLSGIILISAILNFQTARFSIGNDLPYILFLPTYTATAWYHGLLAKSVQRKELRAVLDEAEAFAMTDYTLALMQGARLSADDQASIVKKLASLTGLSAPYIEYSNLRIVIHRFVKEIMRTRRKTVGRFDSRITGIDRDAAGEGLEYDPSFVAVQGVYSSMMNDYVRSELGFEVDIKYEVLAGLYQNWDFGAKNEFLNVGETLRSAMHKNPHLKLLVCNGYYDLATPYFATEYTFNHLELDAELQANVSMCYYEAGHMMYTHLESLRQLKSDLDTFYS